MKRIGWTAALALAVATPAIAQFGADIDSLVSAVRSRDGNKAMELLGARGAALINQRSSSGETPLVVAVSNHDELWTRFLLGKGANPNLSSRDGETPLIAASRIGFTDAVDWLLSAGANVNAENRMGETALIVAVQQRRAPVVKLLMAKGANPDKTDHAAGLSARDYAKRDTRNRELLRIIEAGRPES